MKITRIFLDLDDVCNKFTLYALGWMGCKSTEFDQPPYPELNYSYYDPAWGWDIVKAANTLPSNPPRKKPLSTTEFWKAIERKVWANVPVSGEFSYLILKSTRLVGRDNVFLLSCPTLNPDCLAGKLEWIQCHCPEWMKRQYLIGPPKYCCAQPGSLLIDDRDKNVNEFREQGGEAFLLPRPRNSAHTQDTMSSLKELFTGLLKRKQEVA